MIHAGASGTVGVAVGWEVNPVVVGVGLGNSAVVVGVISVVGVGVTSGMLTTTFAVVSLLSVII